MELQTLFKRENVADPFFIRIMKISLLYLYLIVAQALFRTNDLKSGVLENRFQKDCRFKNGGMLRSRKIC
jgi:hypothetical protein